MCKIMAKGIEKTNVMRILDSKKIEYQAYTYDEEITDGEQVARSLGQNPDRVFKTLVTVGHDKKNYVFVVPVSKTLNLKAAAASVGVKNIEMIPQKQLLPLTGYIHGGCSPIGMKKQFVTVVDQSATQFDKIIFSAGKRGFQVELAPEDLNKVIKADFSPIASDN